MGDPREKNLPRWAQELIADLRRQLAIGNESTLREIGKLRPLNMYLKARNEAYQELLECAAKGGHMTAQQIIDVLNLDRRGDEVMELTEEDVVALLDAMRKMNTTAEVDWTNRSITVLGPVKTDPNVIMSDGKPMQYRDQKFRIRDRS